MKRVGFGVLTKTARFAKTVVSFAQKAVAGQPAFRPGEDGYADWVILAIQGLKEYLNHDYKKLMDILQEMSRVANSLGLTDVQAIDATGVDRVQASQQSRETDGLHLRSGENYAVGRS